MIRPNMPQCANDLLSTALGKHEGQVHLLDQSQSLLVEIGNKDMRVEGVIAGVEFIEQLWLPPGTLGPGPISSPSLAGLALLVLGYAISLRGTSFLHLAPCIVAYAQPIDEEGPFQTFRPTGASGILPQP